MSYSIPGGFPDDDLMEANVEAVANDLGRIISEQMMQSFHDKQWLITTTKQQHDILIQIDSLVYVLIAYQFVKYGHSACLLPMVAHLGIEKLLSSSQIINGDSNTVWMSLNSDDFTEEMRTNLKQLIISKTCLSIYWKTIVTTLYHTIFVYWWMLPLAENDNLSKLQHGSWWVISFIGELVPTDISSDSSTLSKLAKLGLPQLLVTDIVILFLQLTLYQCVYRQSSILNTLVTLVSTQSPEYLIRTPRDLNLMLASSCKVQDRFVVKIKLFESLRKDSYVLTETS